MHSSNRRYRIIISGGGTGGHIFPALSIADALKHRVEADILFVGAENRMEMERVPAAGYKIEGLPVAGFDRKRLWRNFSVLLKLFKSIHKARKIIRQFRPDIAIGVGGYASGPTLKAAQKAGIPTLLQEQNSYAGVTNKLLSKKAQAICVAYPEMGRFFPADRIIMTGNPIRASIIEPRNRREALSTFGLDERPTILAVGGSLGARTINEAMEKLVGSFSRDGIQVIWQTGKGFAERAKVAAKGLKGIVVAPFISDMASAYASATLVVSRAGASSISELEALGKPAVLVPSPNVAEDHQTKNAMALASRGAAILLPDNAVAGSLEKVLRDTLADKKLLERMSKQAAGLARRESAEMIASIALDIIHGKELNYKPE